MVLPSDQARMYFATAAKNIRAVAVATPGLAAALQRFVVHAHLPSLSEALQSFSDPLWPHLIDSILPS